MQIYQNANSALYDAQVYLKNVQDSQAITSNYAGQPAYTYQNDVLDSQVKNKKKQYENSQTAVREASKNQAKYQKERENAQANKNKADSAVKTKGNSILSGKKAKKLSNSQKNAIKSGKEVSLKGIKDKTLLKQLKAYNEQVKKAKDASNKLAQLNKKRQMLQMLWRQQTKMQMMLLRIGLLNRQMLLCNLRLILKHIMMRKLIWKPQIVAMLLLPQS